MLRCQGKFFHDIYFFISFHRVHPSSFSSPLIKARDQYENKMDSGGLLWASSYLQAAAQEYKLWYDEPAQVWTEALPLGNGRLGAMVFGNPGVEHIQLNEETIWAGRPNNNANPDALEYIPKVRRLVFEENILKHKRWLPRK